MRGLKGNRASILFETVLMVVLLVGSLFITEVKVIRLWNKKISNLQSKRLPYDGRRP
jgi:hypothetical protein